MNFNDEKLNKIVKLLKQQSLLVEPEADGLVEVLAKIEINNNKVNIISPFYNYNFMSNSMKVLVSLVAVALLAGGVTYFKLTPATSEKATISESDDLGNLVASLDQEQSEETQLLATEDADVSASGDESSLLSEIKDI